MICRSCLALLFVVPLLPAIAQEASPDAGDILAGYREAAVKRWEDDIKKLEARDESEPDPVDAILFIGSSSIRRWQDLAIDMTPYRTIQRGYGGAKFSDLAVYAERLICPHDYRAVVIFVGNDVSGKPTDHTPDQVEQLVRHVVGVAQRHRPQSPVLLIEVTPTEKRWAVWPKVREVNARLREIALATPHTYFLPTAGHMLRPEGTPRIELFVEDKLHLNRQGYGLWSELIRRRLDEIFRSMVSVPAAVETPEAGQE
jgi:hypothetical protein